VPKKEREILYGHVIVWVINVCSDVGIRLLLEVGFLLYSPLLGCDDARMMI